VLFEDSDTLLAIKLLFSRFPHRAVPETCPPVALYTQLKVAQSSSAVSVLKPARSQCACVSITKYVCIVQDVLFGESNLDLDRELNRLQETREIVMFKFNTSTTDVAVTFQSEYQQVIRPQR
jgi:hypothetical protein